MRQNAQLKIDVFRERTATPLGFSLDLQNPQKICLLKIQVFFQENRGEVSVEMEYMRYAIKSLLGRG